jgi:hypothetical protein
MRAADGAELRTPPGLVGLFILGLIAYRLSTWITSFDELRIIWKDIGSEGHAVEDDSLISFKNRNTNKKDLEETASPRAESNRGM